ncbi:hypothetical protein NZ47_11410 [Anaerovibrio lipolyticus]|uniref:Uncharacterized protein n=1 Tax=Anaerovibrio lipolyticus TaxID=82374 RepID=A0A0B2JX73_9FIRM|nr:hypothetical protein [Anaerovibrio lipolyticus]KHM51283.1 hypothetical protein NZ47_11410 [Anaerovibrio lipolyticus]
MVKEKVIKEDLLEMFDRLEERIKERENKIASYMESFKKFHRIFFYGAGTDAQVIAGLLGDIIKDKEVCFIDKNKKKHGMEVVPGIFCYGIEKMYGYGKKAIIIITTSMYADEIEYELMGEKYQTTEKLLSTPICAEFSLLVARNMEIKSALALKESKLLSFDWNVSAKDRRAAYYSLKELWRGYTFRDFDLDGIIPPEPEVFSVYLRKFLAEHLPREKGNFVLCSAFSKDKIAHLEKAGEGKFNKLYAFELNRLYIPHELAGQVGDNTEVINACLGEKKFQLTREERGNGYNIYNWLDCCSDDFANVRSLDEMLEGGEIEGRISLVRLCIGNGTGPALRGMRKMIQRDKPLLILQPGGHWLMPEECLPSLVVWLHELVPEYKFFGKWHLPEKLDGDRNIYMYL